jgi:hypothetical protein
MYDGFVYDALDQFMLPHLLLEKIRKNSNGQ